MHGAPIRSRFFDFAHVLIGKPVSTFPGHALAHSAERRFGRAEAAGAEPAESSTRSWWNGRHNGFRSRRRKTWEFESLRAHQSSSWRNGRRGGFKSRCPCGVQVQVLPGTPIRGRGGTAHAVGLIPASCRFESCRPHQFALPSPSGKGIWFTPRHSAVRIRQGAPIKTASQASESEKRGPRPITAWYRRGSTSRWHRSGREALNPNGEGADF